MNSKLFLFEALIALAQAQDDEEEDDAFDPLEWEFTSTPCVCYDSTGGWISAYFSNTSYATTFSNGSYSASITAGTVDEVYNHYGVVGLYYGSYSSCTQYFGGNFMVGVTEDILADTGYIANFVEGTTHEAEIEEIALVDGEKECDEIDTDDFTGTYTSWTLGGSVNMKGDLGDEKNSENPCYAKLRLYTSDAYVSSTSYWLATE